MNELQIFNNQNFGELRVTEIEGKIYYCGKDVAKALGYARPNDAIAQHCKGTVKHRTPTNGGVQELLFIPEGDVYRLTAHSKLPKAQEFESWVFDEVLPSIRKTGGYHVPQTYAEALRAYANEVEKKEALLLDNKLKDQQIGELKPKAFFADTVSASEDSILIGQLAKLICQNGYDIGQNRLFAWMRENGFLCKRGESYNLPTQKAIDLGLFEVLERSLNSPKGTTKLKLTTKVTGKGQRYFVEKFCDDKKGRDIIDQ